MHISEDHFQSVFLWWESTRETCVFLTKTYKKLSAYLITTHQFGFKDYSYTNLEKVDSLFQQGYSSYKLISGFKMYETMLLLHNQVFSLCNYWHMRKHINDHHLFALFLNLRMSFICIFLLLILGYIYRCPTSSSNYWHAIHSKFEHNHPSCAHLL